ncbi:programmed cell death protein 7-like [Belonocnema kinseyi]|uniref:programmed cell death protein 7-like n=1 Tax=Belonocnema kinseyi TaxID=2817044 RepID=UPI00143CF59E|nr:programmed cell death protein 7-like [Belonocnema kinseyi]
MFNNYNYPTAPNPGPGFPGYRFPPPFPLNFHPNFSVPPDPNYKPPFPVNLPTDQVNPKVTLETRKQDEKFIKNFLEQEKSSSLSRDSTKPNYDKISRVKNALRLIFKLNRDIKSRCAELRHESLSDSEWHEKMKIVEAMKDEIRSVTMQFEDENFVKIVRRNVERRRKKRLREKRKREAWKKQKEENKEKRARLHAEADNWIKKKEDVIEREKQEDRLRKDADIVLADVRGKRSDAKKFLAMLREIENLRKIKVKIARARGENLPAAADQAFNNIIVKLAEQWTALDREYSLEEQGLKLMIKTDNEEKQEKEKMHAFNNWEDALFGQRIPNNVFLRKSLQNFITIRTMWDKFCNLRGTPIPTGWVVPAPPSSAAWQKLLKKS